MRWVKRIALALVAIVVLLLGIGLALPSTFNIQRSVDASAAPDRTYPLIADPREWVGKLRPISNGLKNLKAISERT
jgi:hypothetical protein